MIDTTSIRGPLGWSLVSIAIIAIFCFYTVTTVVSPLFHLTGDIAVDDGTVSLVEKHDEFVAVDIARFNGRSAFFKPIRRPQPLPPPIPDMKEIEGPKPQGPPPPPIRYSGPPLIALANDEAWFRGSGSGFDSVIRLSVGEESDGLKLVSTAAPSMVIVHHRGKDYPLELFSSDEPFFLDNPPPTASSAFLEEVD